MIRVPQNIAELVTYQPGKRADDITDNRQEKIAKLSSNENTLGSSPNAIASMQKVIGETNWYPDPSCYDLKAKIANKYNITIENVIVGNGSEGILTNVCKAFFEPGDELLTANNTFVTVYIMAEANNIPLVKTPMKPGYQYDLDAILSAISSKTKVIYLANPNNPTGTMFNESAFTHFMSQVSPNILVVMDEAYHEFASDLSTDYPKMTFKDFGNIITLRTFSKAYGLAGMRIGYGLADPFVIDTLSKVKLTFEPSVLAQAAGSGAIEDEEFLSKTIKNNKIGLEYFSNAFAEIGLRYFESFANFIMIEFENEAKVTEVDQSLLQRGIIVRPLKFFGLPNCMRITVGQPWENVMCVKALKDILN